MNLLNRNNGSIWLIVLFFFPILGSCQNEQTKYKIYVPPKIRDTYTFYSSQDSIEFTAFQIKTDSLIKIKSEIANQIILQLNSVTDQNELKINPGKAYILLKQLFVLDRKEATILCFNNYNISAHGDRPQEDDILINFPFLNSASNHLTPKEIIDALISSQKFNKCFSEKEQYQNDMILQLGIMNSFSINYSPPQYAVEKKKILSYVSYLLTIDEIKVKECLYNNLIRLNEYIAIGMKSY